MEHEQGITLLAGACETVLKNDRAGNLLREAINASENGDVDTAVRLARECSSVRPAYADPLLVLADLLLHDQSQEIAAMKYFEQVITREPTNSVAAWYLARHQLRKGEVTIALAVLNAATESHPLDSYAVVTMAWVLHMLGRTDEAASTLCNKLSNQEHPLICQPLQQVLLSRGKLESPFEGVRQGLEDSFSSLVLDEFCQRTRSIRTSHCCKPLASRSSSIPRPTGQSSEECVHLQNPMLDCCRERYGSRLADHYGRTFHDEILYPEISVALRRNSIVEQRPNRREPAITPPDMVLVPAGNYTVGSNRPEFKNPERQCFISAFLIDRYPVSNSQWREFRPDHQYPKALENHPVVNVCFLDAIVYARWRGKRLLTENEWEAAARGPEGRVFPWGQTPDPQRANCAERKIKKTTPVTQFPAGASNCGARDMVGNVQEWVDEWGPPHNGANARITKGGGHAMAMSNLQCWLRGLVPPLTRHANIGFRCAKDLND